MTTPSAAPVPPSLALTSQQRGLRCQYCDAEIEPESEKVQKVIEEVCGEHDILITDLQGRSKVAHLVVARRCVAYRLRNELGMHLKTIGFYLGGRDHGTVHNLLKKYEVDDARV